MDPNTVIIMLATHLICSGGLYYLIGRGMPPRSGLRLWSAGGVLFGSAYIARMVAGRDIEAPWMLTADAAMCSRAGAAARVFSSITATNRRRETGSSFMGC